jgi:hypothetical protein
MAKIPRTLPKGLADWEANKPQLYQVAEHLQRIVDDAPKEWRAVIRTRFEKIAPTPPMGADANEQAKWFLQQPPDWAKAWDGLQELATFQDAYGDAIRWNMDDHEICAWAKKLAAQADELESICLAEEAAQRAMDDARRAEQRRRITGEELEAAAARSLARRVDAIRMLVRMIGVAEDQPIEGAAAIKRAQDPKWWRKRLRVHVARVVEGGAISLGLVHRANGGYISHTGLQRRTQQIRRNAEALTRSLYRNEAGQIYNLAELAALGTSNPVVRGGELMTRVRGAEEYADARAHVGLFVTLTLPSRFHPVKLGSGGRPIRNDKYVPGITPRDGQMWLRENWQKVRSRCGRKGVRMYGLRVAEPHHDATPHWHALLWVETEEQAQELEATIRQYWLADDGDEKGAQKNRVCIKRMVAGGAAGYVAKYIAKSVGHHALAEHLDVVQGQEIQMNLGLDNPEQPQPKETEQDGFAGYRRVDAWASHWGIRQFQTIGMPSVTVWRELRRVSKDQLELFDLDTRKAFIACHRQGDVRADWRAFMEAMGGHACKRQHWHLRVVNQTPERGAANQYGEAIATGRIVGLTPQRGRMCGRWLVSRRIAWTPYIATHAEGGEGAETTAAAEEVQGTGEARTRAALPRPWTGFNNCTARLTGQLHRLAFGRGDHEAEDWNSPDSPDSVLYQPNHQPQSMASRFQQAAHFFQTAH